jgi:hypothetical protein
MFLKRLFINNPARLVLAEEFPDDVKWLLLLIFIVTGHKNGDSWLMFYDMIVEGKSEFGGCRKAGLAIIVAYSVLREE